MYLEGKLIKHSFARHCDFSFTLETCWKFTSIPEREKKQKSKPPGPAKTNKKTTTPKTPPPQNSKPIAVLEKEK